MYLKDYIDQIQANIKPNTVHPKEVVQLLACLIGERLSRTGKLPMACGVGGYLDMDIVNEGIIIGLEKLSEFDATKGSLKQFLYPNMAGAMRDYAWKRENRVGESLPDEQPTAVSFYEKDVPFEPNKRGETQEAEDRDGLPGGMAEDGSKNMMVDARLIEEDSPESLLQREQDEETRSSVLGATLRHLGKEAVAMLRRDAAIGYNAAARQAWAEEIGVSVGALSVRLSRLRRGARDWALTLQ